MILQPGKTYVSIGFVDLSQLLWSEELNQLNISGTVKLIHIDMNAICVARSIIIYRMLTKGMNHHNIFDVWYSSCLNKGTHKDL